MTAATADTRTSITTGIVEMEATVTVAITTAATTSREIALGGDFDDRASLGSFDESVMIKPRAIDRRVKTRRSNPNRDLFGAPDPVRTPRGGMVYREEFQPDRGPDLDESLDVTESGDEF